MNHIQKQAADNNESEPERKRVLLTRENVPPVVMDQIRADERDERDVGIIFTSPGIQHEVSQRTEECDHERGIEQQKLPIPVQIPLPFQRKCIIAFLVVQNVALSCSPECNRESAGDRESLIRSQAGKPAN